MARDAAFEFDLNADIAANLGCPVLLGGKWQQQGQRRTHSLHPAHHRHNGGEGRGNWWACFINRFTGSVNQADEAKTSLFCRVHCPQPLLVYVLPEEESLGNPTINDVRKWLGAQVLYGHGRLDTLVEEYVVAAMHIANFLEYLEKGSLVITPGDRSDIILSSLASRLSTSYPDISGILPHRRAAAIDKRASPHRGVDRRAPGHPLGQGEHLQDSPQAHGTLWPHLPGRHAQDRNRPGPVRSQCQHRGAQAARGHRCVFAHHPENVRVRPHRTGCCRQAATLCCPKATVTGFLRATDILDASRRWGVSPSLATRTRLRNRASVLDVHLSDEIELVNPATSRTSKTT